MLEGARGARTHGTKGNMSTLRRGRCWSRQHSFFFLLLVGVGFFFYVNVHNVGLSWKPEWWISYNLTTRWNSLQNQSLLSPNWTLFSSASSASTPASALSQSPAPYNPPGPYFVEYPSQYHFVINQPQKCEQLKPFLVLVVPVAPYNRDHRDVVRSTWGGQSSVLDKVVMLVFLLGLHSGEGAEQLYEELLEENEEHQDLIQSDFLDCYKNLTIKTMVMLEWLHAYCSGASYAMKIDSDMFLNVPNLINMLADAPKSNYLSGQVVYNAQVRRDRGSKWFVPVEAFPDSVYPPYAYGLGYVFSLDLSEKLLEASKHVRAIYIEDVYVGMCLQFLGLYPTNPPRSNDFHIYPVAYSRCAYSWLIATTTHEDADRRKQWEDFRRPGPPC